MTSKHWFGFLITTLACQIVVSANIPSICDSSELSVMRGIWALNWLISLAFAVAFAAANDREVKSRQSEHRAK